MEPKFDRISHELPFNPVDELFGNENSFEEPFLPVDLLVAKFVDCVFSLRHSSFHFLDFFAHDTHLPFVGLGFDIPQAGHLFKLKDPFLNFPSFFLLLSQFVLALANLLF